MAKYGDLQSDAQVLASTALFAVVAGAVALLIRYMHDQRIKKENDPP